MSDFITEKDPIIVFNPPPNLHGKSPKEIALKEQIQKLEKEHLKLCDELEEMDFEPDNDAYQNKLKAINSKWKEVEEATKRYLEMED